MENVIQNCRDSYVVRTSYFLYYLTSRIFLQAFEFSNVDRIQLLVLVIFNFDILGLKM